MTIRRTIDDVCTQIVDCEHKTAPIDTNGEYFAVGTPAMRGNVINYDESRRISKDTFIKWTRRMLPEPGDLLFAREAPVGPVVLIPATGNVAPGQRTMLLRPDAAQIDSRFLFYLLASPRQQELLLAKASGSTVAHLNVADVRAFKLPVLPGLGEQQAIGEILGALDGKIAANTKLAEIADAWVRAAFEQHASTCTETTPMASLVGLRKEQVDPTAVDPGTPYVGLENIPRRSMWLDSLGTASDVSSNKSRYGAGDILFGKLRPYFHKVVTAPDAGICSTDILVLTAVLQDLEGFALAAASSDEVIRSVTSASEGTRMPRTSWKDLASIEVPWPGAEEAMKLSRKITTLRRSVLNTMNETNTLAATRDALLPQLMSGKLRVRDAEKVLEGAGV